MKKFISLMAVFMTIGAMATQTTALTQKQVRDPRQLEAILEANFADAESRLVAAGVTTAADITLTNGANAGTASISANVDILSDAGDMNKILIPDNGGFKFQSDSASKGTLADILAFGNTGIVTLLGGATIDNSTSASILNLTETNVKVTGAFQVTGATTLSTGLTGVLMAASGVISATAGYTGTNLIITATQTNTITVIGGVITSWTQADITP